MIQYVVTDPELIEQLRRIKVPTPCLDPDGRQFGIFTPAPSETPEEPDEPVELRSE